MPDVVREARVAFPHEGDAADIVHETFLVLLERSASLDSTRGRITTRLFGMARRRAVDRCRWRRLDVVRPDTPRTDPASPEDSAEASERKEALHRAVAELLDRPREVFVPADPRAANPRVGSGIGMLCKPPVRDPDPFTALILLPCPAPG